MKILPQTSYAALATPTTSESRLGALHFRRLLGSPMHDGDTAPGADPDADSMPAAAGSRVWLTAALGGVVLSLLGCASSGGFADKAPKAAHPTDSITPVAAAPFEPPYDPAMGQIVVAVPVVAVSAPVNANAGELGQLVRSQLAGYLSQSRNLVVADRETLTEIGQEHKLAEQGALDPRDRPVAGRLAGARYLIKVDVTDFKEDAVGKAKGGRFETGRVFGLIGAFVPGEAQLAMNALETANITVGKGKETVRGTVGLELRIVDVDTGSVVKATRATGTLTRENTQAVFGVVGFSTTNSSFSQSVVAEAMRGATQYAARQIHAALRDRALDLSRQAMLTAVGTAPEVAAIQAPQGLLPIAK